MGTPFSALSDLKILVVEDEVLIVMMLEAMLEDFGCTIEVAASIETAVDAVRGGRPDGVLLDMNIHGQQPVALAEELARRSVPFLLVTGYGAAEADPPVIRAAPRLQKPFSAAALGQRMVEVFVGGDGG